MNFTPKEIGSSDNISCHESVPGIVIVNLKRCEQKTVYSILSQLSSRFNDWLFLQGENGQETIIIVQTPEGSENATHAIVGEDGTVQYVMQQPEGTETNSQQIYTQIQQQWNDGV